MMNLSSLIIGPEDVTKPIPADVISRLIHSCPVMPDVVVPLPATE
jgi:hypothetical protein